ncbi:MAG: hypothetical protein AAF845_04235 [Bacteroidota bacterium]
MRLVLPLALALLLDPSALAQDSAPEAARISVTYHVQAAVANSEGAPVPGIIVRLSEDPHLTALDVLNAQHNYPRIEAEFAFRSAADYAAWRESEATIALLDALGENVGNFAASLSMRRDPRFVPAID